MKINELQISNVLSFRYFENIEDAPKIVFNNDLNILIGENGAGKSTALEVINFVFKKVLFTQFKVHQDMYGRRDVITATEKKQILFPSNDNSYSSFRLEPNWDSGDKPQKIRMVVELDEIDDANIQHLIDNQKVLSLVANVYSSYAVAPAKTAQKKYTIDVALSKADKNFVAQVSPSASDSSYLYLVNYNFYKELINLHNYENPDAPIRPLYESFTLIGGYRNYHAFTPAVSLRDGLATLQIQQIKEKEFSRSLNTSEQKEPAIFNLVRLRVAGSHYDLGEQALTAEDREERANNASFLLKINNKLKLVNLKCRIRLVNRLRREYTFEFVHLQRDVVLNNIESLSAGQKAIIHLVFEAYGRDELKGGVVIIDEPEIHLHYQFQHEYLRVINEINAEQKCQYILVTHSESLINSVTIHDVKRFALEDKKYTTIKAPVLGTEQKMLVKILDNTRSTYAFFSKKVILVEGEHDRYFFKAFIDAIAPQLVQDIAVLDINGKPVYETWRGFFEMFGLEVYFICDLDSAFKFLYPSEKPYKLCTQQLVNDFKAKHVGIENEIMEKYNQKIFILKNGDLEHYLGIHQKGLPETIKFCNEKLQEYIVDDSNLESKELRGIFARISQ